MNKFIVICLIFLSNFTLYGQSGYKVSGKVSNQYDLAIPNIKVVVSKFNDNYKTYFFTKEDGSFNFDLPQGKYLLEFKDKRKILYKTEISVKDNLDLGNIKINQKIENLSEVVILGRKKIITASNNGIRLNVKGTVLQKKGNALEILQYAPNITDGYKVLGSSDIVIVLNGNELHLKEQEIPSFLSNLKSNNIKSIEVIDRPDSSIGTNKSAVIKIEMDYKKGISGSLYATYIYNSYSGYTTGSDIFLGFNHSRIWVSIYKEFHKTKFDENGKLVSNDLTNNYNRNGRLNRLSQGINIGYEYQRHKTKISLLYDFMDDEDDDYKTITENNITQNQTHYYSINRRYFEHIDKVHTLSFNFQTKIDTLGSKFKLDAEYLYNDYKIPFQQTDSIFQSGNPTTNNLFEQNESDNNNFFITKLTYEKYDKNKNRLRIGIKYSNDKNDYYHNYKNIQNHQLNYNKTFLFKENNYSFFSTYLRNFKQSYLYLGLTLEKTIYRFKDTETSLANRDNYNLLPYLVYNKNFKKISAYIYLTKKIHRPKYYLFDNTVFLTDQISASKGNSHLKPVNQYIIQSGWTFHKTYNFILKYYLENNAILFKKEFDPVINRFVTYPVNEGNSHNFLSVISIPVKLSDKIRFYNNLNIRFSEYKYEGNKNYSTYFNYSLKGNFKFPKNISCSLSMSYSSPYRYYQTHYAYTFNTGLDVYIPISNNFEFNFSINDIFNTSKSQLTYAQNDIINTSLTKYNTQAIYFSLTYNFLKGKKVDNAIEESEFKEEKNRLNR